MTMNLTLETYEDCGFTQRELKEIHLALAYATPQFSHGTDGHNRLLLLARMARLAGFTLSEAGDLALPGWAYRH